MYWLKNCLSRLTLVGALAVSPFIMGETEGAYKPSGEEIAGVSVNFGGPGYYRHRGWGYRHGYYPRHYYRHGYYPRYYYRHSPRYRYYRHSYYNPYYYNYGRPGGIYFYWRN